MTPKPYLQDADCTLYQGDALAVLGSLEAESADCCITSPPYWGLRDYGVEGQLGLEPTPEEYVERIVGIFREVRRVLAAPGTVWLNLGDSYVSDPGKGGSGPGAKQGAHVDYGRERMAQVRDGKAVHSDILRPFAVEGLRPKNLVGIPWRVAFALQADGWYLRSDITWCKPNAMPESVTDRPTKATEMVFLLSKSPRYYYDAEAIRQPHKHDGRQITQVVGGNGSLQHRDGERWPGSGANARNWWEIATQPYPEAHFATFPEELARRCIAAGTSEVGKCAECGNPWIREVERESVLRRPKSATDRHSYPSDARGFTAQQSNRLVRVNTLGWRSSCESHCNTGGLGQPVPTVVLDPFMGSGTVAYVARKLGRHSIGIDLSAEYLELAAKRLQQQSLFAQTS